MVDPSELDALGKRFARDMHRGAVTLAELGYDAGVFRRMLAEHGAVEAARRLVMAEMPSYGLWRLKVMGKLDMSVEMWVLLPWYEPLFGDEVRNQAERKLRLLDVDVKTVLDGLVRRLRPVV